jgi:uncharacterized membrane protein YidH (DUF202 family)
LTGDRPEISTGSTMRSVSEMDDPGLARERTALAWSRSALNMAASGTLIARAAFVEGLDAVGVAVAITMAALAMLTWHHGRAIYDERRLAGAFPHHQSGALSLLTGATVLTAAIAIVVTLAI